MSVHLFGIRHHGPGCARSLLDALHALRPDCILVEGPPEADALLAHVGEPGLEPPCALLVYAPAAPQRAVFYPFAEYSPEWQAIRYANAHAVPVRWCDLPQGHRLAETPAPGEGESADVGTGGEPGDEGDAPRLRADPLAWIAEAAGFSDTETWWDHLVEQRSDSLDLFAAIAEMMTAVREQTAAQEDIQELRREAYMRNMIRAAEKQGCQRIAVVCGAWHVPALARMPTAKSDNDLLKGLPKEKLAATWTPWSYGRLTFASGYGAGVAAPGWYQHVWNHREQASLHWLTSVATLLRRHDLDASSAHIIEAARLADTLAALRDRPRAGLDELMEAVRAVFCYDCELPLQLIRRELLIDDRLGEVPASVPTLPLVQDVQAQQKRLRMAVRADSLDLDLDLRQPAHLEKSVVLHRLGMLGIAWGSRQVVRGKSGTFHELWRLAWEPEFAIRLIEASVWGSTVEEAATACAVSRGAAIADLPALTGLMEQVLLADLRAAVAPLMTRIQEASAHTADPGFLLGALPPLVNVLRYGSARGTDTAALASVVDGLVARACVALPFGVRGIADEAAAQLLVQLIAGDTAIRLLQHDEHGAAWFAALEAGARSEATHPLLAGRAVRILAEQRHWPMDEASRHLLLLCSRAVAPVAAAQWLEGFLQGSGTLLVHNDELWHAINGWVLSLPPETFVELLPLLRRTFGSFAAPERRQLAERASAGAAGTKVSSVDSTQAIDRDRARRVLPVLATLFGSATAREVIHGE
ncbi:DUF5682 family protein [Massilia sp. METH4]|uniref:DUF5682 family protein n=1 Tax=Massilia sp. METH4 TaxID=3123041 RepID=UPI0030CFB172